ncbi:MAG TPA: AtpZ/AtpI family protein [Geminicoccaceae bacterium]|nr:AtpZ/AtpI family protein [Geminicoccaceae bacterium]
MADQGGPPSFEEFDAKLKRLRPGKEPPQDAAGGSAFVRSKYGAGLQVGIELVAGVGFGALLGYGLDRWLGTSPLFLIVLFVLGAAAGTLNAYRWLSRYSAAVAEEDRRSGGADR